VQGVGFRPFVSRLAKEHGITGWTANTPAGVIIEAEGEPEKLERFSADLKTRRPPQSRIDSITMSPLPAAGDAVFEIRQSRSGQAGAAIIPADLAVCPACARDIAEPDNRRFNYPFANCTDCGPRFTIVKSLPYDRANTTMSEFEMCADCAREFGDPDNRRFHAQPNCCPVCGPHITLECGARTFSGETALPEAARLILSGAIAAVKSLGGFQLACDAANAAALDRLRKAKNRPAKPFALMAACAAAAKKFCEMSAEEEALFNSPAAPAVMLRKKENAPAVSPGLATAAVMAAYTPLHRLLFAELAKRGFDGPLVMTSANLRDEPICISKEQVLQRLPGLAGAVLDHNRGIHNRCDDSVAFVQDGQPRIIRRARGYTPQSVRLGRGGGCALGAGGQMKGAFCLARGAEAFLSQHIGEMDEPGCESFYLETLEKMQALLGVKAETAAHDLHPDYAATRIAKSLGVKTVAVQHHYAHIASVMAEHDINGPVIGLAFDGTGLGPDGSIWGGEILVCEGAKWERRGALKAVRLPGGDVAAVEIWRMALSWIMSVYGNNWRDKAGRVFGGLDGVDTAARMIESGFNSPYTTSMGRLFDAMSFLCGGPAKAGYEAQAAMEFESLCRGGADDGWNFDIYKENGLWVMDPSPLIRAALENPLPRAAAARRFHGALCAAAAAAVQKISPESGTKKIALSGGVFQNRLLLGLCTGRLARAGYEVYCNRQVPANDGGLALGQVYAARSTLGA